MISFMFKIIIGLDSFLIKDDFVVKVLGLNWNIFSDEFFLDFFSLYVYVKLFLFSKWRFVLKVIMKIFDLMGFLMLFMIGLKILF